MTEPVKNGDTVRVHYTGRFENGNVFDTSAGGDPLEFRVGAGEVIPGFDDAVRGMRAGETKTVEIAPDDAYGPRHQSLMTSLPRDTTQFPAEPQVGMNLILPLADGNQLEIVITEVTDTHVTIDGNHPLAGHTLTFDLELVDNTSQKS